MTINPKSSSSLLRGFGADGTSLEKKLKLTAKEAEQRWPIIRAIAPSKGVPPPPLTAEEKALWNAQMPMPARTATRKTSLSLPSLGDKISANLEKLIQHKSYLVPAVQRPETVAPTSADFSAAHPVHTTPAPTLANEEEKSTSSGAKIVASPPSGIGGQSLKFLDIESNHFLKANNSDAGEMGIQGLFTSASPIAAGVAPQPETISQVLFSQRTNASPTNDQPVNSLFQAFARIEGKDIAVGNATSKSTKSFMRRITKR